MPGDKWAQYAEQPTDKWAQYAEPAQGNASQASISDQPPGLLSRADSAITSFLAPNPHNYDSIASTNLKEAPKTLGRELYSGVKNIAGTPGAIYHAFADPPTDEEKQRISGDENQQPPDQIDYALDRMIVHPLQVAGKFYGDAIRGKVPDATGQMLNVAPEAMGISASGVVAPKLFKAAVPKLIEGARAVGKFAGAPSDPDILYQSYLKPVAGARMPVPNAPEPVMRAILRDMEAAGEGDAAARISRNEATVGDLDQVRQTANRLSRSIYRSPGNYTPGMAEGANNLANSIRERTYPFIESSQGMGPGSLQDVKKLQGAQMESARNPTLTSRVIKRGGGAIGGGAIGYKLGGPGGAALGAIAGERLAEPIANAADRGIMGLRTKALAAKLPPPGLTPRLGLPPSRILSPIENEPGPPSFTEFSNSGTRASRLGLLLPEKATGKIELSGDPEMTPGERTAALEHELRRNKQRALPQKASPILLPKSNQAAASPKISSSTASPKAAAYDPEKMFDQIDNQIDLAEKQGYTRFGLRAARGSKEIGESIPNSFHEGSGKEGIEAELNGTAAFDARQLKDAIRHVIEYHAGEPDVHIELIGGHSANAGELLHDETDANGEFHPAGTEWGMPEEGAITIPGARRLAIVDPETPAPQQITELRRNKQRALPQKASPILLPKSNQ